MTCFLPKFLIFYFLSYHFTLYLIASLFILLLHSLSYLPGHMMKNMLSFKPVYFLQIKVKSIWILALVKSHATTLSPQKVLIPVL